MLNDVITDTKNDECHGCVCMSVCVCDCVINDMNGHRFHLLEYTAELLNWLLNMAEGFFITGLPILIRSRT